MKDEQQSKLRPNGKSLNIFDMTIFAKRVKFVRYKNWNISKQIYTLYMETKHVFEVFVALQVIQSPVSFSTDREKLSYE